MVGKISKFAAVVIEFFKTLYGIMFLSSSPPDKATDRPTERRCSADEGIALEQGPLTANPSILLNVLCYGLEPRDLAALEATCRIFRNPANFPPDTALSLPELAAYDMCRRKAAFRRMKHEDLELLKKRCGGSWKHVLEYVLVGEKNYRREQPQVVAGPGHSIVVTAKGDVYSFGDNRLGQLGLGHTENQFKPCLIRSLQGIRITQAAVGANRTMLVSDTGSVYTFGHDILGWEDTTGMAGAIPHVSSPKLVESLNGVFVVQASIGCYFTAVLSRTGHVYTFSWGRGDKRLGHDSDPLDVEPRLLTGPYGDTPVVQISAGNCFLLILVYKPTGMSVYSVGCGNGGKLGHLKTVDEGIPKLIEDFEEPGKQPLSISAGPLHSAVLGREGQVFTWGWCGHGCLGFKLAEGYCFRPLALKHLLKSDKAVHVSTGRYTTFVVGESGNVYSFGSGMSYNLGFQDGAGDVITPRMVASLAALREKIVQISATHSYDWRNQDEGRPVYAHTIVLTESGKMYSFGGGAKGQLGLGFKLLEGQEAEAIPSRVAVDLI